MPEVSLHTAVKGQFGLGTGRAMGKALKKAMFLGRIYRKKRRLSLSPLHSPQKARKLLKGMWRPPTQNVSGQERKWFDSVVYSHAAFCGCGDCIGHLSRLAADLGRPSGAHPPSQHQPPPLRRLPALPAPPNPSGDRAAWPTGGGDDGEDGPGEGGAAGGFADLADEELLTAAVEAAEE